VCNARSTVELTNNSNSVKPLLFQTGCFAFRQPNSSVKSVTPQALRGFINRCKQFFRVSNWNVDLGARSAHVRGIPATAVPLCVRPHGQSDKYHNLECRSWCEASGVSLFLSLATVCCLPMPLALNAMTSRGLWTVVGIALEQYKHSFSYDSNLPVVAGPDSSVTICCTRVKARNPSSVALIFTFFCLQWLTWWCSDAYCFPEHCCCFAAMVPTDADRSCESSIGCSVFREGRPPCCRPRVPSAL
jgi:hypothetical protein